MRFVPGKLTLALLVCFAVAWPAAAATEDVVNGRMSANWAGYVATRQKFTGVGASWTVAPLAATTTLMTEVAWVGIGGSRTRDLIQAGTHSAVQHGRTYYWAWYELIPAYQEVVELKVSAGDKISASIVEVSRGLWLVSLNNLTTGGSFYKVVEYRSKYSSAEWIQEMPVVYDREGNRLYAPLSEFDEVEFDDAYALVGGQRQSLEAAGARPVTMVAKTNKKVILATPSQIEDGDSFVVVRSDAVPSPASSKRSKAWEITWSK